MPGRLRRSLLGSIAAVLLASPAGAAELTWAGPPTCREGATVRDEVERLVGRPLAEVTSLDFHVTVVDEAPDRWKLSLTTSERDGAEASGARAFSGKSCSEVVGAAAVAIALAVQEREVASDGREEREPRDRPIDSQMSAPVVVARALPAADDVEPPAPDGGSDWAVVPGLAALVDIGSLPSAAAGIELDVGLRMGVARAAVFGAAFPAQETRSAGRRGGSFELLMAGVLACVQRRAGPTEVAGCAGLEAGRLSGEGVGVLSSRRGASTWLAPRAEGGIAFPTGAGVRLFARAGVAVPLVRRQFVLDSSVPVHEPSVVAARGLLGFELDAANFSGP